MTQTLYVLAAFAIGTGSALQISLVANMGRLRGPTEAAWINVLGTFGGMALVFLIGSLRDDPPNLPAPFDAPTPYVVAAVITGIALAISVKGLEPYLALTGVFGFTYLFGAGYLAPKIGIALFASAVTAGTLITSVGLDHIGAFGGEIHRVSMLRIAGLGALMLGVVLVRSSR
ncbi:MAG TPA: DMT family transporter [Dehalococcoidia bacterium]|nr:DMT family transporter [Dehalococcoidia bacterium]